MSLLKIPTPGFLAGSFLFCDDKFEISELKNIWTTKFGPSIFFKHSYFPMKDYYSKEMGDADKLNRFFAISLGLISREKLVPAKLWSTDLECVHSVDGARILNLDMGLLTLENFSLATGKNFCHRIYLGEGVFSDLTYIYEAKSFKTVSWSYPDYAHAEIVDFFNNGRQILSQKIKRNLLQK